jgi:acyl-CoA reductase-like NAD-dependent aldehyde dehydrogenase
MSKEVKGNDSEKEIHHRSIINGKWQESAQQLAVYSPWQKNSVSTSTSTSISVAERVPYSHASLATAAQVEEALATTETAFAQYRHSSRYIRSALLLAMARLMGERRQELAESIVGEAGKPLTLALTEVTRAIGTFTIASEEVKRFGGKIVPVNTDASSRAFTSSEVHSFPRGPVLAITPFNFPLNLMAHKVAPALAAGCSIIVKPPPQAPGAARMLAEIFVQAAQEVSDASEQIPLSVFQVFSANNELVMPAITDPRIKTLSFTGSERVGWMMQEKANKKLVILELGGNAAVIVHSDADLKRAATRCAFGAFAYAGQICISVQRILVHRSVAAEFQKLLLEATAALGFGDPWSASTVIGPLIDSGAVKRIMSWIDEAKDHGAHLLCGGSISKIAPQMMEPTLISGVKTTDRLFTEEVFGPVALLDTYETVEEAINSVNNSRFGLQAGVFTDSHQMIHRLTQELEVGGLIVNEIPTFRADHLPYGGVKESGLGREGVHSAMEHFSEQKVVVTWHG